MTIMSASWSLATRTMSRFGLPMSVVKEWRSVSEIESLTADARQRLEATPAVARCLNGQVEMPTYQAFLTDMG